MGTNRVGHIFFFQAEDGIRDVAVTGVQTCALPISILHSYRAFGEQAVERWRGMFALCLVDPARGVGYLVRDRLGIKPLYFCRLPGGGVAFASELRALLAL